MQTIIEGNQDQAKRKCIEFHDRNGKIHRFCDKISESQNTKHLCVSIVKSMRFSILIINPNFKDHN